MALEEYLGNWEEWKIWIKRHDRAGTRASKCVHMWRVFFRANGDLVMRFGAENGFAFCFLNKKLRIFPKEKRKKKKQGRVRGEGRNAFPGWSRGRRPPSQQRTTNMTPPRTGQCSLLPEVEQKHTRGHGQKPAPQLSPQPDSLVISAARKTILNKITMSPKNVKGTATLVSKPPQHSPNPTPRSPSYKAHLHLHF